MEGYASSLQIKGLLVWRLVQGKELQPPPQNHRFEMPQTKKQKTYIGPEKKRLTLGVLRPDLDSKELRGKVVETKQLLVFVPGVGFW